MLATAAPPILIIGGGLTGAAVGRALCRNMPVDNIVVWEASEGIGGRFATERPTNGGACDTGAQYVTITDDLAVAEENAALYDELLGKGTLAPMAGRIEGTRAADGGGKNYVAPNGVSSIVSHLFSSCGLRPTCARSAVSLRRGKLAAGGGWEVRAADGHTQVFSGVVLTQPVPEMLSLLDSGEGGEWLDAPVADDISERLKRSDLTSLQYSSRYALSLFFPPSAASTFGAEIDWVARYISKEEDDALVYIGHDSAKRSGGGGGGGGGDAEGVVSLIAHTSVPYGIKQLKQGAAESDVLSDLTTRVKKLLPWLPEPQHVTLKAWGVSQVRSGPRGHQRLACEASPTSPCTPSHLTLHPIPPHLTSPALTPPALTSGALSSQSVRRRRVLAPAASGGGGGEAGGGGGGAGGAAAHPCGRRLLAPRFSLRRLRAVGRACGANDAPGAGPRQLSRSLAALYVNCLRLTNLRRNRAQISSFYAHCDYFEAQIEAGARFDSVAHSLDLRR